jgi:hypothetical protein
MESVHGHAGDPDLYSPRIIEVPTFGNDRKCVDCGHTLSIYNKTDRCFSHEGNAIKTKPIPQKPKQAAKPGKTGTCLNCKRENIGICPEGFCWFCHRSTRLKTGEDRERALAEAREKISSGRVGRWGRMKLKDKKEEVETMSAEVMMSIIGTCKNCERPGLKIEPTGRGFCGTCRTIAAKHKDPEEQKNALAEAKIRLQAKGGRAVRKTRPDNASPGTQAPGSPIEPVRGRFKKTKKKASKRKSPAVKSRKNISQLPPPILPDPVIPSEYNIQITSLRERELFGKILRLSEEQWRTPSQQAFMYIKAGMEALEPPF